MPAVTPVTTPPLVIVATPVDMLLHVPPNVASLNVVVAPKQIAVAPVIGLTVQLGKVICAHQVSNIFALAELASWFV